ncbi:MAG: tetratricopeptide repeat protein [Saprospiraceae bacterium]|nr:tetratricopeptide repeat protein [Saprospiraceae bacterium]
MRNLILLLSFLILAVACGKKGENPEIKALEQETSTTFNLESGKKLLALYQAEAQKNAADHALAYQYLVKAANLQYKLGDAVGAARSANEALKNHAEGQDKTGAIAVLQKISKDYHYRTASTHAFNTEDVNAMLSNLQGNQPAMDSVLAQTARAMGNPVVTDNNKALEFIDLSEGYAHVIGYDKYADKYAMLLLRAAGLAKSIEEPQKALQLYDDIATRLPQHPKAPTALFMTAFIYENDLGQMDNARKAYEQFLNVYPTDQDFADDARVALKMLGKSPEEIIKGFEGK